MTTKPTQSEEADPIETEDEDLDTGFTPEEEAALDAAAKGEEVVVVKKTDDKKPAVVVKKTEAAPETDDEITKLRGQVKEANDRAEKAETARKAAEQKQVASVDDLEGGEVDRIKQADEKIKTDIELADRDVKDLTRQLREAKENGELDKEMEVNDKLLDAKIKFKKLDDAKEQFETWKGGRKDFWDKERKKTEKRNQQAADPDAFNAADYTPKALEWIEENPQFKTDKKFRSRSVAAHYAAEAEDIKVDTPEYFEFIDQYLGKKSGATAEEQEAEDDAQADTATEIKPAPKKADKKPAKFQTQLPPSREAAGGTQRQSGNRIKKLTAEEREAAEISGMTNEEYWDDKYGNQN